MEKITIVKEFFDELMDFEARSLVGKLLKRIELFDDKDTLKKAIKEVTYEEIRNLKNILEAHDKGLNALKVYTFNKREKAS